MAESVISTGISGLDHILRGGLPAQRLFLLQGDPGVGKTTLALQFLIEGAQRREPALYVTFSESGAEVEDIARAHGWSLGGLHFFRAEDVHRSLEGMRAGTVFHPSETELTAVTKSLWALMDEHKPRRMVFDSLSELRLIAGDQLRYRRQLLELKRRAQAIGCTVIVVDDRTGGGDDMQLHSLAHGVISMQRHAKGYGATKRCLEVAKMRGVGFRTGWHDFEITTGGIRVYPRLVAAEHAQVGGGVLSSGVPEMDALLGGGIDRGSGTLLVGPAGSGKSTVAMRFAVSAAQRGEKTHMYLFEESPSMLRTRAKGVGMNMEALEDKGVISLRTIDATEISPGQFAHHVMRAVEQEGVRLIVIDSLNGYMNAMPDERHLALHLHELLVYTAARGVALLLIVSQSGMMGPAMTQPLDASYLADTVLLFRFYEHAGEVRKALSVTKRRAGGHEPTIRPFSICPPDAIRLGEPLRNFRGVLSGTPVVVGQENGKAERPG
ncbi:MAG TPA: ATPase domain-containing protein [Phycisphaerales bacterium]|nr:ATPase domain-containing protein [Phycisphaerales bacterium]